MDRAVLPIMTTKKDAEHEASEQAARRRTDEAMERYARGDASAFSQLYRELEPRLRRFVRARAGSWSLADDVIQQTLLAIHRSRSTYVTGAPVLPWAFAIARNLLTDSWRSGAFECAEPCEPEKEPAAYALAPDEALDLRRRAAAVSDEVHALPAHLREALLLTTVDRLSVAEAAAVLGITRTNVKVRVFRARQRLKRRTPVHGRSSSQEPTAWSVTAPGPLA
jgi:RNA polymerase sigma-70 factor (ECF subfamily)